MLINDLIVVDIETTGLNPVYNKITEIGAVKIKDGKIVDTYQQLINPRTELSSKITEITGLTNEMLDTQPGIETVFPKFMDFAEELPLLGHNIMFDYSFLKFNGNLLGYGFERKGLDTYPLCHVFLPGLKSKSLTSLIEYLGINREKAHRAFHDALATYEVFSYFERLAEKGDRKDRDLFIPKPLHWKAKKESPITLKQKSYLKALVEKHGMYSHVIIDQLSKSEASRLIDKILFEKGRG